MKIALSILTLSLCVWALPALATPSHQIHARGKSEASASRSAKHTDLDLRLDAKGKGSIGRGNAVRSTRYEQAPDSKDSKDWKSEWPTTTEPGGAGALVPEPSAILLFGVGLVVALQAIPRRSSYSGATGE